MPPRKPLLGGHVSAAGGLANAVANGLAIGAQTIQIFGSSPRQWLVRHPKPENVASYKEALSKSGIGPVFLHGPYLVNLASPDQAARKKSEDALRDHLAIAEAIGAAGLIFHIGSGGELPKEKSFPIVVRAMKSILKQVPGKALLIAENSAGGGGKIGAKIEDLGAILDETGPRAAACIDTAHAFESGLVPEYSEAEVKKLGDLVRKHIGWKRLAALHVNDSKTPFNSRNDRHENIGAGYIGLDGFRNLMRHRDFRSVPWLLEVPGPDGSGPDKKNVDILKKLAAEV